MYKNMFGKNKRLKKQARNLDKIITTVIIGSALAGVFGLSKTKKGRSATKGILNKSIPVLRTISKKTMGLFGKTLSGFVGLFNKKK